MEDKYNKVKLGERGARISIAAYIALSIFKLLVGYFSGSKALMADGLNNSTDIVASLAVLIGLKISRKPVDEDHPYGHWRAETISSLIASIIMLAVGVDVLFNAGKSVVFFEAQTPNLAASVTGLICAAVILMVYRYNKKIAISINSSALMAAAKDNLSDAWVSIGTSIGIIASQFGLPWIDPLAALIVGVLICKTGWDIFAEAAHNLTDGFSKEKLKCITSSISKIDGVKNIKGIRARNHGNNILLDVVVSVDPTLSVTESHKITEIIESRLKYEFEITDIIIHVEPD